MNIGRRWTRDCLIAACQQFERSHGRPPYQREWVDWRTGYPSHETAARLFGSWNAMILAAGLRPRPKGNSAEWTRAEVLEAIFSFRFREGRLPTTRDWVLSAPDRPSASQVKRLFGSWNAAIVAAGYKPTVSYRDVHGYHAQTGNLKRIRDDSGRLR